MQNYIFPILLGLCVGSHLWMMFKGHGSHGKHEEKEGKKNSKEHSSCH